MLNTVLVVRSCGPILVAWLRLQHRNAQKLTSSTIQKQQNNSSGHYVYECTCSGQLTKNTLKATSFLFKHSAVLLGKFYSKRIKTILPEKVVSDFLSCPMEVNLQHVYRIAG